MCFTEKISILIFISIISLSCSNHNQMTQAESDRIINEVKNAYNKITEHSQKAQLDSFLSYYDNSPYFLSISADGKMNNCKEFKKTCSEYYTLLREQSIITTREQFQLLDKNIVIVGWTGNIIANFKNGDIVKMNNYSITSVFKKIDEKWKIIHDHESALPPDIIKGK